MANQYRICAMKERHIGVAAICIPKRYVVFNNGLMLPIIGFLDDNRQPIDDGWAARYYQFGDDESGYGTGNFDTYEMPSWKDH